MPGPLSGRYRNPQAVLRRHAAARGGRGVSGQARRTVIAHSRAPRLTHGSQSIATFQNLVQLGHQSLTRQGVPAALQAKVPLPDLVKAGVAENARRQKYRAKGAALLGAIRAKDYSRARSIASIYTNPTERAKAMKAIEGFEHPKMAKGKGFSLPNISLPGQSGTDRIRGGGPSTSGLKAYQQSPEAGRVAAGALLPVGGLAGVVARYLPKGVQLARGLGAARSAQQALGAGRVVEAGRRGAQAARHLGVGRTARAGAARVAARAAPTAAKTGSRYSLTQRAHALLYNKLAQMVALEGGAAGAGAVAGRQIGKRGEIYRAARGKTAGGGQPGPPTDPLGLAVKGVSAVTAPHRTYRAGQAGARLAGRGARALGRGLGISPQTAATAGRVAGYAGRPVAAVGRPLVKHPVISSLAAAPLLEVPGIATSGDPGERLKGALEGGGVFGTIGQKGGDIASKAVPSKIAQNLVKDAFNLPAQTLPSVYLPLAAGFEAAVKGDTSRFKTLWEGPINPQTGKREGGYRDSGLLPAIFVKKDAGAAMKAFQEHPLFATLEASGGYAVAGRGTRRIAGTGALGPKARQIASRERAPRKHYGDVQEQRQYSANFYTALLQRRGEKAQARKGARRPIREAIQERELRDPLYRDPAQATPQQTERYLTGASLQGARAGASSGLIPGLFDAFEQVRRGHRDRVMSEAAEARPKHHAGLVAEATQGSVRATNRETFLADLETRRAELVEALPGMKRSEKAAARQSIEAIDKALTGKHNLRDNPELFGPISEAAGRFAKEHKGDTDEFIERYGVDPEQFRRARLAPYAMRHMGARKDTPEGGGEPRWVDRHGKPLEPDRIEAQMRKEGIDPETVGFLTHRAGWRGRGSYYQAFQGGRGTYPRGVRTGEQFRKGAYDDSYEALAEQRAYTRTLVDRPAHFDQTLHELGVAKPGGGYFDWKEAVRAARDPADHGLDVPPNVNMVPIRVAPFQARAAERAAAKEFQDPAEFATLSPDSEAALTRQLGVTEELLNEATRPGGGDVLLVPEQLVEQMRQMVRAPLPSEKVLQSFTQSFKTTVLPTSSKWVMGNMFELGMRSFMNGLRPISDRKLAREWLGEIERKGGPAARERAEAMTVGSGFHYGSKRAMDIHRQGTHEFSRSWSALASTPGPGHLIRAYRSYAQGMFRLNAWFERQGGMAALGQAVRRDVQHTTGSWGRAVRAGESAMRDLVKDGRVGTEAQLRYANHVYDVFGRWKANSPAARSFLVNYAPFWMWTRAASRFVLLTMPIKHPVKQGIIAAAQEMTAEERKRLGLDFFADRPLPAFLQGSIPAGGGAYPTNLFSSFGVFADYPQSVAGAVLPQFGGFIDAFAGVDFAGRQLTHKNGTPLNPAERAAYGAYLQLEAFMPLLGIARRVREGGGSTAGTSTVLRPQTSKRSEREGTDLLGGLKRTFVPRRYDPELINFLRSLAGMRQINIPVTKKRQNPNDFTNVGASSGANDYSKWLQGLGN